MSRIKLYDKRDFDYYNPKPYLLKMMSIFNAEDYRILKNWSSSSVRHLFRDEDSDGRLLDNALEIATQEELDILINECHNVLERKASRVHEDIDNYERKISSYNEMIIEYTDKKNEYVKALEELKNVISKSTTNSET